MASELPDLNLGRLLRMRAMVTQTAQIDATVAAGGALTRAYLSLRDEMLRILAPEALTSLREEFVELFPIIKEPPEFNRDRLLLAASEGQMNLRKLQGWIQGLIDEMTFEDRLRAEAEATAAQAGRPPLGFTG